MPDPSATAKGLGEAGARWRRIFHQADYGTYRAS
jgi:hypothetical protein